MDDPGFEDEVAGLFEATPRFDDSELFAARLDARLSRRMLGRRMAIVSAATAGVGTAGAGLLASGAPQQLRQGLDSVQGMASRFASETAGGAGWVHAVSSGGQASWIALGLCLLAFGLVAQRPELG